MTAPNDERAGETAGPAIHVPEVRGPMARLCYTPQPLTEGMARCDRKLGHLGQHSWEMQAWIARFNKLPDIVARAEENGRLDGVHEVRAACAALAQELRLIEAMMHHEYELTPIVVAGWAVRLQALSEPRV